MSSDNEGSSIWAMDKAHQKGCIKPCGNKYNLILSVGMRKKKSYTLNTRMTTQEAGKAQTCIEQSFMMSSTSLTHLNKSS